MIEQFTNNFGNEDGEPIPSMERGGYRFDFENHQVSRNGKTVTFGISAWAVLSILMDVGARGKTPITIGQIQKEMAKPKLDVRIENRGVEAAIDELNDSFRSLTPESEEGLIEEPYDDSQFRLTQKYRTILCRVDDANGNAEE